MKRSKTLCKIISKDYLTDDIVSIRFESPDIAASAVAGQFVSVYTDSSSELLPRPISICDVEPDKGLVRIVFRIVGKGTAMFSEKKEGDYLQIIGPLGNGYSEAVASLPDNSNVIITGGGIGIPPMLGLAKSLNNGDLCDNKNCKINVVLGYRDILFLNEEFEQYGNVYIASEDGKHGTKGNVIDAIMSGKTGNNASDEENTSTVNPGIDINNIDAIFACGPMPMLRGIKSFAEEHNIEAWISLEEKMACGIGACLACVCNSTDVDSHSMVHNKRICKDGPVFNAKEVDI